MLGLAVGASIGTATLRALEIICEELRRIRAYERAREKLRRFIQGE